MKPLTIAQTYTICAIDQKGKKVAYPNTTHSGCVVMAAFLELFLSGNISLNAKKQVTLVRTPPAQPVYLRLVWNALSSGRPKTLKQWMEYYLNDFSVKMIRRIVNAVIHSLIAEGCVVCGKKPGIFHERISYRLNPKTIEDVRYGIRNALFDEDPISSEQKALCILLSDSGLLQKYIPREELEQVKPRLDEMADSDIGSKAAVVHEVLTELDTFLATTSLNNFFLH